MFHHARRPPNGERSGSCGTAWVWSDFLATMSPAWSSSVSRGTSLHWPVGTGAERNEGVADLDNVEEAAKLADGPGALPRSLINAPGKSGYPIVSFTWLVFPIQARDAATRDSLTDLLRWILSSGQ